jgi:hypothetical protein
MMIVLGPQVRHGSYGGFFNHYSTLVTIERGLGLPCLAHACQANSLPVF